MKKTKKIPSKIKLGPYLYRIEMVKSLQDGKGTDLMGHCKSGEHLIELREELPPDRERAVLLHELMHAMWEMGALEEETKEELAVLILSPLLLGVMKENPKLMEYLLNE